MVFMIDLLLRCELSLLAYMSPSRARARRQGHTLVIVFDFRARKRGPEYPNDPFALGAFAV
jgi:hypothetical protein